MQTVQRILDITRSYLASTSERKLEVRLAKCRQEIHAAQALRQAVFSSEMAMIPFPAKSLDEDEFDDYCEHLIVLDHATDEIVGTYRILFSKAAQNLGYYYAEKEFDLHNLGSIRHSLVELGRSCVHPQYRDGAVIRLLWSGLGDLLGRSAERFIIGCPSVPAHDGGHYAAALYRKLSRKNLGSEALKVYPKNRLPYETLYANCDPVIPPLIKGYLRCGAQLLGEPHRDLAFGSVDFPMMVPVEAIEKRYSRKFIPYRTSVTQEPSAIA